MSVIRCPEPACPTWAEIYSLCPDDALMRMMWHFLAVHPEQCPLELLDRIEIEKTKLETNGV